MGVLSVYGGQFIRNGCFHSTRIHRYTQHSGGHRLKDNHLQPRQFHLSICTCCTIQSHSSMARIVDFLIHSLSRRKYKSLKKNYSKKDFLQKKFFLIFFILFSFCPVFFFIFCNRSLDARTDLTPRKLATRNIITNSWPTSQNIVQRMSLGRHLSDALRQRIASDSRSVPANQSSIVSQPLV